MKRSKVNQIIRESIALMKAYQFQLPPFAFWHVSEWRQNAKHCQEIFENQLGWDITDFGGDDFAKTGLVLFTIRNGHPSNWVKQSGKLYAEKIMISSVNQVTPMHFHWNKMEDIINRNGGDLVMDVFKADDAEGLSKDDFHLSVDGKQIFCKAGQRIVLKPGESVSFPPGIYHSFWAETKPVLIGEVSLVNDDHNDNRFLDTVGRFPAIEEDSEPEFLLVGDYVNYF
jgi:D-lyxose ketol-isomerase